MPVVSFLIFIFVWLRLRNADPAIQRQTLLTITPLLIGLAIGGSFGNASFLIIGFVFSVLLGLWFTVFRFPASYRKGLKQFQTHQFNEAHQSLNQAIQEKPDLWEAYQVRSLVNSSLGYFTNAEKDAQKAISLNPKAAVNYYALGNAYWMQADFDQARHAYEDANRRTPNQPLYQYYLGIMYFKIRLFEDAKETLNQTSKSRNLPQKILPESCLFLYYYLGKSEENLGFEENARKAFKEMKKYQGNFSILKSQLDHYPPKLRESMEVDVANMEGILNS